ncbi:MAG: hypothetical protein WBG92_03905 [Thiohalocapsa sp.]
MHKFVTLTSWMGLFSMQAIAANLALGADQGALAPTFADALRAAGWQVEQLADGSLQLTPGSRSQEPVVPAASATSSPQPTLETTGWPMLRRAGWRVETQPDGATLLFPPGTRGDSVEPGLLKSSPAPETPPFAAPGPIPASTQPPPQQNLDTLLSERGWRAERATDGSLLLLPLGANTAGPAGESAGANAQTVPPAVQDGRVQLPLHGWKSARLAARSWLETTGDETLRVGKIRQILKVYLVTIVDRNRSAVLRHQIAIGVDDGRVTVLYSKP